MRIMDQEAAGGSRDRARAADLVVEDGRIESLVPAGKSPAQPVDQTFDASRHVVIPGLINTHHHFFQTLTRAHPAAINKELFPWLKALYPIWAKNVKPEAFRLATRLALTELLLSGCTCASDHHYLYPRGLEEAMDIQAEEAAARRHAHDAEPRLDEPVGEGRRPAARQRRAGRGHDPCRLRARAVAAITTRREGAMMQVALAPCAPFTVTKRLMVDTVGLAEKHNCRLHTHLGETRDENEYCLEHFACRPVDYLEECGWLTDRVWLAHGIHFDDRRSAPVSAATASASATARLPT